MKRALFWFGPMLSVLILVAMPITAPLADNHQEGATITPTPDPVFTDIAGSYPRVDGSTSAHPLQMQIACAIFGVPCEVQWSYFEATPTIMPAPKSSPLPVIQHTGTHNAYVNLIEGAADLILVARAPSNDEREAAKARNVVLDSRPVALDAFVFVLHASNPVRNLTIEQIRGIYTGGITNWKALGVEAAGEDTMIRAYQREPNSGSRELMDSLVMKGEPMIEGPDLLVLTMSGLIEAVVHDRWGIGYTVYYYATYMTPRAAWEVLSLPSVEGVAPRPDTFRDHTYPFTTEVYVVTRADMPANSTAILLRDWLLTPGGQAVIEHSGYVALAASEDASKGD